MKTICLCGKKGSGKTTLAKSIYTTFGDGILLFDFEEGNVDRSLPTCTNNTKIKIHHLAEPLKKYVLFNAGESFIDFKFDKYTLEDVLKKETQKGKEFYRGLYQKTGDHLLKVYGKEVFCKLCFKNFDSKAINIVADVRYQHEVDFFNVNTLNFSVLLHNITKHNIKDPHISEKCDLNTSLKIIREDISSLYFKEATYILENSNFKMSDVVSYNEKYWYLYPLNMYINNFLEVQFTKPQKYVCLFYFEGITRREVDD